MSSLLKLRRGSTIAHETFTGADGEITFDTDKNAIVTHDGSTVGGFVGGGFHRTEVAAAAIGDGRDNLRNANIFGSVEGKLRESVSIKDFGGVCDGVTPDDDAMDAALAFIGTKGHIELMGSPLFNRPVTLPTNGKGIRIFAKSEITVRCNHNGDGFVLSTLNENYGGHVLENLLIQGPNASYPGAVYTPPSTGAGIKMQTSYDNTFINTKVRGFLYGAWLHTGFNNKTVGDCEFLFNQYGVYIAGGATNLNRFNGAKIRENRISGVVITGVSGAPYPTKNSFSGAYIETNIPYNAGYPIGGPGDGSTSVGVKLLQTYGNDFSEVYFENQEYDFWLGNSASDNNFMFTRHAPSSDYSRLGKIRFDGANVNNNRFIGATQISRNITDVHVEANSASAVFNSFTDCTGFNFIAGSIIATLDLLNNRPYSLTYGTPKGFMTRYSHGYLSNPSEGTARGRINGIGTATANLNAEGYGEIQLGNTITSATTIDTISNLKPGQILILSNYQPTYAVTIKASTDGITGIHLKNRKNAILKDYSDSITFYCSGLFKVVEIGRSISAPQGSQAAKPGSIAAGSSYSIAVTVTGAGLADYTTATFNASLAGLAISSYVSVANTITVVLTNNTAGAIVLGAGTFRAMVINA